MLLLCHAVPLGIPDHGQQPTGVESFVRSDAGTRPCHFASSQIACGCLAAGVFVALATSALVATIRQEKSWSNSFTHTSQLLHLHACMWQGCNVSLFDALPPPIHQEAGLRWL